MHHDSHILSAHSDYCETCGQRLPSAQDGFATWERKSKNQKIGIGISIALHLLGVAYYLFSPTHKPVKPTTAKHGEMVYIAPLSEPKKPNKPVAKPEKPKAVKSSPPQKPTMSRSTPAAAPKLETYVPPVQATMTPPPEQDMSEMIAKRRAARESQNPQPTPQPPAETEAERGKRIALANIMGAQGRSASGEREQKGGLLEILDLRANSADVKFRHWNSNFKREWLQAVHVDRGAEADIESAVIHRVMELIRKDWPEEVPFDSKRQGRVVVLSTRPADDAQMFAFLMKEFFPDYKKPYR
ncbi:hypothetical protein GTP46_01255 [Duganella sp. FT135W]|uniref:Uncharacterized protein n=1 Tax=Duganella flavida TaxID=2692175 RepID=A0A6L8K1F1_9BURK|nr:hypothetical protein [Duganella flavida]MYM21276.1 hypothetical protein [Duganella flavida]